MNSDDTDDKDDKVKFTTLPSFAIQRSDMVLTFAVEEHKPTYIKLYTTSVLVLAIINTLWLT